MPYSENIKNVSMPLDTKIARKINSGIASPQVAFNYVNLISERTGRNVIVYYSSFPNASYGDASSVIEWDISGFMKVMTDLDRSKGLDLIIQTPGGDPRAAEGIVEYLHAEFKGDIRVIVPYCAYSAGTLISCAAKTIIMGNHSCLGPVDPQLGPIACLNILKDYDDAREDIIANPNSIGYWKLRLADYGSGLYLKCKDAVAMGDELLNNWLHKYMFAGESGPEVDAKITRIYQKLNSNNLSHGRHFTYNFCKELGLKVEQLEADPELHKLVMCLHHALEYTMAEYGLAKFLMSQLGITADISVPRQETEE